jgi:hypothetical protein
MAQNELRRKMGTRKTWFCPPTFFPCHLPRHKMVMNSFGKREISCSQWKGSTCTHERSSFPPFRGLGGGGVGFFGFFPCSQCVYIMFSLSSQRVPKCVPQHDPNSTWVLTHMVCPKFNSHVYKLKTWQVSRLNINMAYASTSSTYSLDDVSPKFNF